MGQAKIRTREIAELKAQGPRIKQPSKTIVKAFGAFYHDNHEDGVGVYLSNEFEPSPGWTNLTFHILKDLVIKEAQQTPLEASARAEAIAFRWANLRESIELYNRQIFGTTKRNMFATPMSTALTDRLIETFVHIITNIWYLELMKEIPNDDNNGVIIEFYQ
jgi:hypothetical protein